MSSKVGSIGESSAAVEAWEWFLSCRRNKGFRVSHDCCVTLFCYFSFNDSIINSLYLKKNLFNQENHHHVLFTEWQRRFGDTSAQVTFEHHHQIVKGIMYSVFIVKGGARHEFTDASDTLCEIRISKIVGCHVKDKPNGLKAFQNKLCGQQQSFWVHVVVVVVIWSDIYIYDIWYTFDLVATSAVPKHSITTPSPVNNQAVYIYMSRQLFTVFPVFCYPYPTLFKNKKGVWFLTLELPFTRHCLSVDVRAVFHAFSHIPSWVNTWV